MVLARY